MVWEWQRSRVESRPSPAVDVMPSLAVGGKQQPPPQLEESEVVAQQHSRKDGENLKKMLSLCGCLAVISRFGHR